MLVQLVGVPHALEIGTYTGYNEDFAKIARSYFAKSPFGHKITLEFDNALDTIQMMAHELDFVFIDADSVKEKLTPLSFIIFLCKIIRN